MKLSDRCCLLTQVQVQVQPQQQIQESTSQQQPVQQNTEQQIVQVCTFVTHLHFVSLSKNKSFFSVSFWILSILAIVTIYRCRSRASSKVRCWVRSSRCPLAPISSYKVWLLHSWFSLGSSLRNSTSRYADAHVYSIMAGLWILSSARVLIYLSSSFHVF